MNRPGETSISARHLAALASSLLSESRPPPAPQALPGGAPSGQAVPAPCKPIASDEARAHCNAELRTLLLAPPERDDGWVPALRPLLASQVLIACWGGQLSGTDLAQRWGLVYTRPSAQTRLLTVFSEIEWLERHADGRSCRAWLTPLASAVEAAVALGFDGIECNPGSTRAAVVGRRELLRLREQHIA